MRPVTTFVIVLLTLGGIMTTVKLGNSTPPGDDYDYFPMRSLVMPGIENFAAVIYPLKDFSKAKGYTFQVSSPGQAKESILFDIEAKAFDISGSNRLDEPGLKFSIYWHADVADEQALDTIAEQLRQVLAPFGTVTVTAAPPGTRPRKESTNLWRKRR